MEKTSIKKKTVIILVVVVCLFVLLLIQCMKYVLQNQELWKANEELSVMLADRDETIEADARQMEDQQADITRLEILLAKPASMQEKPVSMQEYETETGFVKKDGVYLIDKESQMWQLKQMIEDGEEIEPEVAAAEASYRLRVNLRMSDWFSLGTEENPFCGRFDGDDKSIEGKFPFMEGADEPEAVFRTDKTAIIENLEINNRMEQSSECIIRISVENDRECAELESNLARFPDCGVRLEIDALDLDTRKIADAMRERWERNQEQNGYCVSISFYPGYEGEPEILLQTAMAPFDALAGEEYGEIIEEAMNQEEGYLRFLKLERIGELNCCSFEIGELDGDGDGFDRQGEGYHIILEGKWEGEEISRQHVYIPYTTHGSYSIGAHYGTYDVENVDIDFDGKKDLLILEGYTSGSGGSSWDNYRAIVWNEKSGQFEYFPSFPEHVSSLELDRRRVIVEANLGASYETVTVYGVVNGEYVPVRELINEYIHNWEKQETTNLLSYYEMGELVETHILSDDYEKDWLYPDMDYWRRG